MPRPRDFQKSRIYKAENRIHEALKERGLDAKMESIPEVDAFVKHVTQSRFWKSKTIPNFAARGKPVRVKDGRGRRIACAGWSALGYYVALPKWARTKLTTVHEMTHVACYHNRVSHGRMFARTMLAMTRRFLGKEAGDLLAEQYKLLRVKRVGRDVGPTTIHYIPTAPVESVVSVVSREGQPNE